MHAGTDGPDGPPSSRPVTVTSLGRRALGEFIGTALMLAAVIGSGVAAQRLSPGDAGLQLLENALATAAALMAIILAIGPVSGSHLNPVVTLAGRVLGGITTGEAGVYVGAQVAGGAFGAVLANLMFSLPAVELSTKVRSSWGLWLGEIVATFGLLLVIFALARSGRTSSAPFAVGAYIGGAYFFTSSTSVANPAATIARGLSDSFAGIAPSSAPAFIAMQLLGTALAVVVVRVLYPTVADLAADVVLPHPTGGDRPASRSEADSRRPDAVPQPGSGRRVQPHEATLLAQMAEDLAAEYFGVFSLGTVGRFVDESFSQLGEATTVAASLPALTERFARERLRALAQAQGVVVSEVPEVLFVCVHNAGRSQMAAGLLVHHAQGLVHVRSAGSAPVEEINPAVVVVMAEVGVDLAEAFPKPLTDEVIRAADVIVTMGCGDACPLYPGKRYLDWQLEDPAGRGVEEVRAIRDDIDRRVRALLAELVPAGA